MLLEDIHDNLCLAVLRAGATDCDQLIPDKQATKADAVFLAERVIVEVKQLKADRNKDRSVRQRSGEILQHSAAHEGGPVFFGDCSVTLDHLPKATAEKLLANLGQRVRKDARDASKQIKATAKALDLVPRGLMVMGVPAHYDTHPGVVLTALSRFLPRHKHRSIQGVLIVSVPVDNEPPVGPLTISFCPRDGCEIPKDIIERSAGSWLNLLAEIDNVPVSVEAKAFPDFEQIYLVKDEDWPSSSKSE